MSALTTCPAPPAQRVSVRYGRRDLPVMHLTELGDTLRQRWRWRTPSVLCGAEIDEDLDADLDQQHDEECPGCLTACATARSACARRSGPSPRT